MIDLVIFDSDGVLVDSEAIALAVMAQAATAAGAPMDAAEALAVFRGLKIADCVAEIERRAGRSAPAGFIAEVRAATAAAFEAIEAEPGRDLIVADDAAAMADAIRRLLADPQGAAALGRAARARMEAAYAWGRRLAPLAGLVLPGRRKAAA